MGVDYAAIWSAAGAAGSVGAAVVAAWAARQSRASASEANAAARALAEIERGRRHAELTPRFRVICEPWNPGADTLRLRVMLLGPPGLDHLDSVTVRIRDDHFRRADGAILPGGPTREEIQAHIWGPYMFTPGTGPDEARSDRTGRVTVYAHPLPVGEELPFALDPTLPGRWMGSTTPEAWRRERGTVIRLAIDAHHDSDGDWTIPCEIDVGEAKEAVAVTVP